MQDRRALDGAVLAKSCKCVEGTGASEERLRAEMAVPGEEEAQGVVWPCV